MYQPSVPVNGFAAPDGPAGIGRHGELVGERGAEVRGLPGAVDDRVDLAGLEVGLEGVAVHVERGAGVLEGLQVGERVGEAALVGGALAGVIHEGATEGAGPAELVVDALVDAELDRAVLDTGEELVGGRRRGRERAACRTTGPRP